MEDWRQGRRGKEGREGSRIEREGRGFEGLGRKGVLYPLLNSLARVQDLMEKTGCREYRR